MRPIIFMLFQWLLICSIPITGMAQQTKAISQDYPFIRYDANHLHYDTNSPYLQHFFCKWNQMTTSGIGHLNIVHIGSSHVQGGIFPNRVRYNLMSEMPHLTSDRGMIFPYSAAAKCNNPLDYTVHSTEQMMLTRCVYDSLQQPLGLCGIAVTACDTPTRILIALRKNNLDYATRQVIIIGQTNSTVIPLLSQQGKTLEPTIIDSVTNQYIFHLERATDSIEIVLPCNKGETFSLRGIYLGNQQPGFSYHSIGVNGAKVADYQKCSLFDTDLPLVSPDLVIFGIGINDAISPKFDTAVFFRQYMQLALSFRQSNPMCAFVFITNNDFYTLLGKGRKARRQANSKGPLVREVFYRLAQATGGAVWDQFEIMGGLKSMDRWHKAKLAKRDLVHFTPKGYTLLGDMLYNALVEAYQNNHCSEETETQTDTIKADTTNPIQSLNQQ